MAVSIHKPSIFDPASQPVKGEVVKRITYIAADKSEWTSERDAGIRQLALNIYQELFPTHAPNDRYVAVLHDLLERGCVITMPSRDHLLIDPL